MLYILDKAYSKSDVLKKKMDFYSLLKGYNIREFDYNYYDEKNLNYSIVNQEIYNDLINQFSEKDEEYISKCIDKINKIEILRRSNNKGFDNVGHILLTANSFIIKIAYCKYMYNKGDVPKATDVDFLINRFWFKLNKGFGKGNTPKSIDVVMRSRIILSFLANDKVSMAYDKVMEDYKSEKISKEDAIELVAELRSYTKTPDEVMDDSIFYDIESISNYDVNKRLEEMKRDEIEKQKNKKYIKELEESIERIKQEKEKLDNINKQEIESLKTDLLMSKKDNKSLQDQVTEIKNQLIERDENERKLKLIRKSKVIFEIKLSLIILLSIILFFILVYAVKFERSISGAASIVLTIVFGLPVIVNFLKKKGGQMKS